MREQGLPLDQPIAESLAPIPAAHVHEHNAELDKLTEEERVAFAMQCRCCS
jgi:N-methylhydantoinase B